MKPSIFFLPYLRSLSSLSLTPHLAAVRPLRTALRSSISPSSRSFTTSQNLQAPMSKPKKKKKKKQQRRGEPTAAERRISEFHSWYSFFFSLPLPPASLGKAHHVFKTFYLFLSLSLCSICNTRVQERLTKPTTKCSSAPLSTNPRRRCPRPCTFRDCATCDTGPSRGPGRCWSRSGGRDTGWSSSGSGRR